MGDSDFWIFLLLLNLEYGGKFLSPRFLYNTDLKQNQSAFRASISESSPFPEPISSSPSLRLIEKVEGGVNIQSAVLPSVTK